MTKEITLWAALIAVALALFRLWWVAVDRGHMLSAMKQAKIEELDSWNRRPRPPMSEADLKCQQQARLYSAIKNSKRIQVIRAWRPDPEHTELIVGEPLAFGVDHNGCGWVTIKKDDGHVTHIMHFIAGSVNSFGMEIVEVKFI